jgi:GT2 family glycosyltransferase
MIDVLAERPHAGIVGPVLLARSDPDRIASAGLRYHRASGRMRQIEEGMLVAARDFPRAIDVDAVSGAVMLVRRAVFDAIGILDEQFFFGFEDLEFCLRASNAGFASVVAGRAVAYHEVSGSIGSDSAARLYFAARNHLLLARRLERRPGGFAATARTAGIVMLNAAHAVRARPGALPSRLEAVARGVRDYALGRFGPGPQIP